MTIKEELYEMRELDQRVAALGVMIADLRNTLTAIDYSEVRVQASKVNADLSELVAKIDEYRDELDAEVNQLLEMRRRLRKELAEILSGRQLQVIMLRYFCSNSSWASIAGTLGCSYQNAQRIHDRAIANIERKQKKCINGCGKVVEGCGDNVI